MSVLQHKAVVPWRSAQKENTMNTRWAARAKLQTDLGVAISSARQTGVPLIEIANIVEDLVNRLRQQDAVLKPIVY